MGPQRTVDTPAVSRAGRGCDRDLQESHTCIRALPSSSHDAQLSKGFIEGQWCSERFLSAPPAFPEIPGNQRLVSIFRWLYSEYSASLTYLETQTVSSCSGDCNVYPEPLFSLFKRNVSRPCILLPVSVLPS